MLSGRTVAIEFTEIDNRSGRLFSPQYARARAGGSAQAILTWRAFIDRRPLKSACRCKASVPPTSSLRGVLIRYRH